MKKLVLFTIIFLSFISCSPFIPDNLEVEVTKKTTIKDIGDCTEPIVITMPVYKNYNLFGNKNMGSRLKQIGDIFVVIDTETNKLYDWVYEPNEYCFVYWRCVELGKGKEKKYFSSSITGTQSYLQAGSNKVQRYKTNAYNTYMINYSSVGTNSLLISNGWDDERELETYKVTVFDSISGKATKINENIYTSAFGYMSHPISDEEGNYYVGYQQKDYDYIAKIDTKNKSFHIYDKKYLYKGITDEHGKCHDVKGVFENKLYLSELILGIDPCTSPVLYVLDINNGSLENEKRYYFPEGKIKENEAGYFYTGVFYNKKFYGILPVSLESKFYIVEIDPNGDGGEAKLFLEEPVLFDMTETVWLRGSKLYVMNSRRLADVKYMYIDLETKEQSEVFRLTYEQVIES